MHVLFLDDYYVIVNKPAGLLVHRSPIDNQAQEFALQLVRDCIGQHVFPVHRLDKPTSGALLFGLSSEAAKAASQLFDAHRISKIYRAIVRGFVEQEAVIDYPLSIVPETKKEKKRDLPKKTQEAITHYRSLASVELPYPVGRYQTCRYSFVELAPRSGRKHQLRRHMKHISHPIIGDTRYGDWRHNRFVESQFNCHRMLLHAASLQFIHPFTGEAMRVTAPFDERFTDVLEQMGLKGSLEDSFNTP